MQEAQTQGAKKPGLPRVIAVSSGKGGVGKSSICVNLGISLAKTGQKVCLLDADTGLANANILLGITSQFSLEHVLYGAKSIEDVMLDGPHGLKIIPGANGISECVTLHPRQQLRLTRELARIEMNFDYLLIDTAAGIADNTLDFVSAAHHTFVVITPEPTSLTDAFSLVKLLKRRRSTIHYHVIVNMCSSSNQAKEVYHRFDAAVQKYIGVQCQYLGHILRDESMRAAVVLQNPVAMFPDEDPSCRSFVTLAEKVAAITGVVPASGSFSAYWHGQYRNQRKGFSKPKESAAEPKSHVDAAKNRDTDYLSELRSRLLLLVEQGHADTLLIKGLLQEGLEAYISRYKHSPVDVLALVDQLVLSPTRDDHLLRGIADRVKPWAVLNKMPLSEELSLEDLLDTNLDDDASTKAAQELSQDLDQAPPWEPNISPEVDPIQESSMDIHAEPLVAVKTDATPLNVESNEGQPELPATINVHTQSAPTTTVVALNNQSSIHGFDVNRFGSQDKLVTVLQRQGESEKTLVELLDAFHLG